MVVSAYRTAPVRQSGSESGGDTHASEGEVLKLEKVKRPRRHKRLAQKAGGRVAKETAGFYVAGHLLEVHVRDEDVDVRVSPGGYLADTFKGYDGFVPKEVGEDRDESHGYEVAVRPDGVYVAVHLIVRKMFGILGFIIKFQLSSNPGAAVVFHMPSQPLELGAAM
ncbi:hypothetical protein EMCRGX_G022179 [Ephydatia muelleri]